MMKTAILVIGILLVLASLAPLVRSDQWWIRFFDFPRLQLAIALAGLIVAALILFSPASLSGAAFLLALAATLAYQAWRVFPYTPLATPEVLLSRDCEPASRVRLMIANVLMDNRRAEDFLALVRGADPDLIFTVETDDWWDEQLEVLRESYPFGLARPLDNTYGLHLFSRLDLDSPEIRFLVEDDVPSVRTRVRLRSGQWIDFIGLHPRPPRPGQDTEQRDAEILIVGKEMKESNRPTIVAGDLNDVAWSHTTRLFRRTSGALDPRIGRGRFSTFHARYPVLRWPLDHVFHTDTFTLIEMRRLGYYGSDHFPVLIELCLEREAELVQEAPAPEGNDREEARDKIEEGKEAGG
jgi:endonuclease/exonuclease/phosphatase (EEP) superfamily protein YafD